MLNQATLMGRLVRDPELRHTKSGKAVCHFTLAINRPRKGEEQKADFFEVIAWHKKAEFVQHYFKKGMMCIVIGHLQNENWKDENGKNHVSMRVVAHTVQFGESKKSQDSNATEDDAFLMDAEDFEDLGEEFDEVIF